LINHEKEAAREKYHRKKNKWMNKTSGTSCQFREKACRYYGKNNGSE
jgi:hypothetical protein